MDLPLGCCLQLAYLHLSAEPPALVAELPLLRPLGLSSDAAWYAQGASSQQRALQQMLPEGPYPALQHLCAEWPAIRWVVLTGACMG